MITPTENDQLTEVGPGTLMGNLLREYWHPIASLSQLDDEPVMPVDLLGERLVLFKDGSGSLGLLDRACAHRETSLAYGIPEHDGLRCAYHGWLWAKDGRCLEQPSEPEGSTYHEKVATTAYPVQALGGLVFAYLGRAHPPLLPQYNVLVWEHVYRETNGTTVPCNWLQVVENILDPAHIENLHGRYFGYVLQRTDSDEAQFFKSRMSPRPMKGMRFDLFDAGIVERHFCETRQEHSWMAGSPIFFPSTAMMVRNEGAGTLIFIVPLDDERTWFVEHRAGPAHGRPEPQPSVPYFEVSGSDEHGRPLIATANGQDHMAVTTQGPRAGRRGEHLSATDAGIIMYRQLLLDQARAVSDGGRPMNVRRGLGNNHRVDAPTPAAGLDLQG